MSGDFDSGFLNKFSRIREIHLKAFLEKHGHLLKWKPKETILDIGCGTGDLTHKYIYPLIPEDFQQLLCTDISQEMIQKAKKQFEGKPKVHFNLLDITSDLQEEMENKFTHIFSIFCLMWIANQRKAFENTYKLLSPGGGCFLAFVESHVFMETIFELLEGPKWKRFVPVLEDMYPFPYRKDPDSVKTVTDMMKSIGYVNFKVFREETNFVFNSEEEFLGFFKALPNPLPLMTAEEQEDYLKDAIEVAYTKKLIRDSADEVNGALLVVYGEK